MYKCRSDSNNPLVNSALMKGDKHVTSEFWTEILYTMYMYMYND